MRHTFMVAVVVFIGVLGYFWYATVSSTCRIPLRYDIGFIDERFGISRDEVRQAVSDAESLWEDATGRNIFTYEQGAKLSVNFLYDNRQELTDREQRYLDELDRRAEVNESIKKEYTALTASYDDLRKGYEGRLSAYERDLLSYNEEVSRWNDEGGAPEEAFNQLKAKEAALEKENKDLNGLAQQLNALVKKINSLGEQGNASVGDYNEDVEEFNETFATEREFTQGDYSDNTIHIYQYKNPMELRLVLAHELGHALSLQHVEDERSVMYHILKSDNVSLALSEADIVEFKRVCGEE